MPSEQINAPVGTVYSVRARTGLRPLKFGAPDDFEAENPLPVGEFPSSRALPYCFDFPAKELVFTLHDNVEEVLAAPFLHAAQRRNAKEVVRVPWQKLDALFGPHDPKVTPTLIFSVGRCGSTLLHTLARAFVPRAYSEPDTVTNLGYSRRWRRQLGGFKDDDLIWHALSPLMAVKSVDQPVIKFRSQANRMAPDIARLFPKAKYVFMFRQPKDWGRSLHRAFGIAPADAVKQFVVGMRAASAVTRTANCEIVTYEELLSTPGSVMSRIFGPKIINRIPDHAAVIERAMAADSQGHTIVSRSRLKPRPNEKQWLNTFQTEWENAKPRRLLKKLKLDF